MYSSSQFLSYRERRTHIHIPRFSLKKNRNNFSINNLEKNFEHRAKLFDIIVPWEYELQRPIAVITSQLHVPLFTYVGISRESKNKMVFLGLGFLAIVMLV